MAERSVYTVSQVAAMTGFSRGTVTRMFERERGILMLNRPESMHKRRYRSIRIPRAVYERVIAKLSVN
jgi:AraC-like DNA-binding protein